MSDSLHFILLEDDNLDAELVQEGVRAAGLGARWTRVVDQEQFRRALTDAPVDLILSDFQLPSYSGLEALELAYAVAQSTPFIFVSGAIGEEMAIETLRRGAVDYVLKDRLQHLPSAIRRALQLGSERKRREAAEAERDRLILSERRARESAEAANRMKDEFLATASHELRTPLNAILGWAKVLRSGASPDLVSRGLATIERNAVAQSRLIEDILDISRIVTGKVQLHVAPTPVATFVHAAVEALRPAAAAKQIELTLNAADVGEIEGDAERLQQVLWNLVSNAIKFTPAGGSVVVTAEQQTKLLRLVVADNGQGLEESILSQVFERFWQADPSVTRRYGGLGLGLSIVRYLVELHGGSVKAESAGLGAGSRFVVELPTSSVAKQAAPGLSPEPAALPEPASEELPTSSLAGLHVLVVDDDADAREIASLILSGHGATVTLAAGAREAIELVRERAPHVLISDIGMPDVDGYSFIRAIRALPADQGGELPAIALSAFTRQMDRERALSAGFHAHLAKPMTPSALVTAVRDVSRARASA